MALKKVLAAALSATAFCIAAPATYAQEIAVQHYEIPTQNLGAALTDLARQSGREIYFSADLTRGKKSPPINGDLRLDQALDRILSGSGLSYRLNSSGAITIQATTNSQSPLKRSQDISGNLVASGKVVDDRTGANLKGALVEIVGTDRSTSTDDLGTFRFPGLAPGSYDIRISYLGYMEAIATLDARRDAEPARIALTGGSNGNEIVVIGRRSARAQSLNEERSAENSTTVLASDFLGQFDGDTISEAMRRAPGIAFEQDEVTGDGTNVIVRGLAPDLNMVTFNGLRLPEGSGTERSASLGNILTDSIAKITINKTLLPSHDSYGTGGLIEIETKGPLDRPRRFASFSLSGSKRGNGFRDGLLASGTVSATFGAQNNIGLSVSAQYRKQDIKRISYSVNLGAYGSEYLPLAADGTPLTSTAFIDPRTEFPFAPGVDGLYPTGITNSFNGASTSNLTLTVSGQWKIADHTELRADYSRAEEDRDSFTRSASINSVVRFQLMPIEELGGEVRAALVAENIFGFPGVAMRTSQRATLERDRNDSTHSLSFRGETNVDAWKFNYTFGFAKGSTTTPYIGDVVTASSRTNVAPFLLPEALANVTSTGRVISAFSPRTGNGFPLPLLNQAGFDSSNNDQFSSASLSTGNAGENERYTTDLSSRHTFEGSFIKYIEAGLFYENAAFKSPPALSDDRFTVYPVSTSNRPPIRDLGLGYAGESLSDIGLTGGFDVLSLGDVRSFLDNLRAIAEGNPLLTVYTGDLDARLQKTFTKEENASVYLQGRVDIGKLEVIGGVRIDHIKLEARNLTVPGVTDENWEYDQEFANKNAGLIDQKVTQTAFLPRIAATYRRGDNLLFRAGFATTVARPRIQDLSDQHNVALFLAPELGPNLDQPALYVWQGNPDLKPARTNNFDLSAERYFSDAGQIKVSLFYKVISNILEQTNTIGIDSLDGVELPDDPRFANLPDDIFIEVTKPVNAPEIAKIWGVEVAFEKQFTFLPGFWSGFGVFANYTYSDSSKTQPLIYYDPNTSEQLTARISGVPFAGAPKHSGTAALTYNKYGIDATLAYTTQARRLSTFGAFNLSEYYERDSSLDLRAEYRFKRAGGDWRFWIEGSDLLKGTGDPDVETSIGGTGSTPKYYTGGNYYGGRSVNVGASITL